jgi:polyribonucleotide nucleotidyltransferase
MLHYNFPPFSVGEVKFLRSPGRREIGHGSLAEKAISKVLPSKDEFPYTIRIVSEVMESNGSSSMATVCGSVLSLMDAGVPIKAPVAGIALGLIKEGDDFIVLSDILGDEDHIGDMDFKVAGTREGVTALQMDIKITGITPEILNKALAQAREGRLFILDKMGTTLQEPRSSLSNWAPRIATIQLKQDKIGDVIGPGGKIIKNIVEKTGAKIEIDDTGKVNIYSSSSESVQKAIDMVQNIIQEAEIDKIYRGTVKRIMDFGAFVEIFPGTDGLVHISQLAEGRVQNVRDVLKEGDEVMVKVLEIDKQGKIKLSRKEALNHSPEKQ